jgi:malate dehydrogenase (oxaloacetate-decarboxylating)
MQGAWFTMYMKMAAAIALASLISEEELKPDYVIADPFDPRVAKVIAKAVADEAVRSGITK